MKVFFTKYLYTNFIFDNDCLLMEFCVFHFQVTINIQLTGNVVYVVANPTWHNIRVQGGYFYGLRFSPESDGVKFSVIVQNTVQSLQGNHH